MELFKIFLSVLMQRIILIEAQLEKKFKRASTITSEVDIYKLDEFLKHQHCTSTSIKRRSSFECTIQCGKMPDCQSFTTVGDKCYLCSTEVDPGNLYDLDLSSEMFIWYDQFSAGDQCYKTSGSGPHPMSCLIAWWLEAGCALNGNRSPTVNDASVDFWQSNNVDDVKSDMLRYFQRANDGVHNYELFCFGH